MDLGTLSLALLDVFEDGALAASTEDVDHYFCPAGLIDRPPIDPDERTSLIGVLGVDGQRYVIEIRPFGAQLGFGGPADG